MYINTFHPLNTARIQLTGRMAMGNVFYQKSARLNKNMVLELDTICENVWTKTYQ